MADRFTGSKEFFHIKYRSFERACLAKVKIQSFDTKLLPPLK